MKPQGRTLSRFCIIDLMSGPEAEAAVVIGDLT